MLRHVFSILLRFSQFRQPSPLPGQQDTPQRLFEAPPSNWQQLRTGEQIQDVTE